MALNLGIIERASPTGCSPVPPNSPRAIHGLALRRLEFITRRRELRAPRHVQILRWPNPNRLLQRFRKEFEADARLAYVL